MTGAVRYCTRWNDVTRRPIAGYEWIDDGEALRRFECDEFIDVVDSADVDDDGLPLPRWVIGVSGPRNGARVQFLDKNGSIWRTVDYQVVDGRLFRTRISDKTYPDDQQRWDLNESTHTADLIVNPDGSGDIETRTRATGERSITEFAGLDVSAHWLDIPEFGDWDALTEPGRSATEIAQGS